MFNKDEHNERAIVRSLLEFGLKEWEENVTVAEYIFKELDEGELEPMMENQQLVSVIHTYRDWYNAGNNPTDKDFLYAEDKGMGMLVIELMDSQTEISPKWSEHFEGKILTREDYFKDEIISTLTHFKMRKILKMIFENQRQMEKAFTGEEQELFMKIHLALKAEEKLLTQHLGTVIFK